MLEVSYPIAFGRVKLVVVDDHLILRDLLVGSCERDFGHQVVGQAGTGREAIEVILRTKPDLVVLDIQLPDINGFEVIEVVRKAGFEGRILLLSGYCDPHTVYLVERAQVQGFVDKPTSASGALRDAFAALAQGTAYFSETFLRVQTARRRDPRSFDKLLSDTEQRLLAMFGELLTDREIAERLNISELTVEKHRFNIRHKLGMNSRAELMRYVRDHGFMLRVSPPPGLVA